LAFTVVVPFRRRVFGSDFLSRDHIFIHRHSGKKTEKERAIIGQEIGCEDLV